LTDGPLPPASPRASRRQARLPLGGRTELRGVAAGFVAIAAGAWFSCARAVPPPRTTLDEQTPRLVSAFFGLDHALPQEARGLCLEAPGANGMPVTFSRRVVGDIEPRAFTVRTRSGARLHPTCATTRPARSPYKNHTVLLIGDFGREPTDPPLEVEVTGALALAGGVDAKGLSAPVIPLAEGPRLVLALGLEPGAIPSDCPAPRTRAMVAVVWAGGVTPAPGADDEAHRAGYEVTTSAGTIKPFALGDLHDRDNYVYLCLDEPARPERVRFAPAIVVDPRGDPNPETAVAVSPQR
jgi:hypothetical protein